MLTVRHWKVLQVQCVTALLFRDERMSLSIKADLLVCINVDSLWFERELIKVNCNKMVFFIIILFDMTHGV